jgi:DNA-binding beta-propeller fold protein YncE
VGDQQTAPCWVTISPDGRYLFAVNTGSGTISRYSIATGGALTLLGGTQVSANGGVGAVDPGLSPDGRFLYVNESQAKLAGDRVPGHRPSPGDDGGWPQRAAALAARR